MRQVAHRAILAGLLFAAVAFAQRDLGTLAGTVTDQTGAAIPNAKVTITEVATNQSFVVTSSSAGEYVRPALKPGIYTVTAEAKGFRRVAQENVVVTAGDRIGVPLTLPVGDVSESIEVTANAPLLQTESTSQGANLNTAEVTQLPLGGQRVFTYLARLSPGVLPAETGARDAQSGGFSANGVRSTGENNFLLNGVDNNVNVIDFINQTSFVIGPSLEAIGEMQVLTNGYNAEYGRAAGGVVNVNLKSGTNQIHGDAVRVPSKYRPGCQPLGKQSGGRGASPATAEPIRRQLPADRSSRTSCSSLAITRAPTSRLPAVWSRTWDMASSKPFPRRLRFRATFPGCWARPSAPIRSPAIDPPERDFRSQPATVLQQRCRQHLYAHPVPRNNTIPATHMDPAAAKIAALYPAPNQPFVNGNFPRTITTRSLPAL